jgi:hypothetical protein
MSGTLQVGNIIGPTTGTDANKVIIPSGQTLDASNGFVAPAGHVIQTVKSKWYGYQDTNNTSFVSVDDSLINITPKYANSQLLIRYSIHYFVRNSQLHGIAPYFYVPSTNNWSVLTSQSTFNEGARVANDSQSSFLMWSTLSFEHLIGVPGTGTEQVSFKVYHKSSDGQSVRINDNGPGSSITVQEIAQ